MSLTTPLVAPAQAAATAPTARSHRLHAGVVLLSLDTTLAIGLAALGLLLRLPYLWTIPRFSDETREVLRAIELLSGGLSNADRLVNVDAYIGGLYLWLLAGLFWLTGVSALTPRLVMAVAGAVAVAVTYLLARSLGGRLAGVVAAGLLATSGAQILSNGHLAWSHCLTPTLTTLAIWLLQRAVRQESPESGARWSMLGSGFTFGLALQTHPATLVLLPGAAVYVLWWGRRWLRTPWPYLAALLFVAAYSNMLAYNLMTAGGSLREAAIVRERYDHGIIVDILVYLGNQLTHDLMLLRYLAGAVDAREGLAAYLLDPSLWLYGALSVAGLVYCARRGAPLLLLVTISSVLVMPYFNQRKYVPISDGRYLMPLLPLAYAAIGALLAAGWERWKPHPQPLPTAMERGAHRTGSPSPLRWRGGLGVGLPWLRIAFVVGVLLLVLYPLAPLARYFGQEVAAGRTNTPLLQVVDAVGAARRPDEPVLLDRDLADVKLEGGGTAFRSLRFLLAGVGIDDRSVDSASDYVRKMTPGATALLVTDARGFGSLARELDGLKPSGITSSAVVTPPGRDGYGAYRLERGGDALTPLPPLRDGSWGGENMLGEARREARGATGVPESPERSIGSVLASSAALGRRSLGLYSVPQQDADAATVRADTGLAAVVADEPVDQRQALPKNTAVPVERFASSLVNPRGLAFREDWSLFVALAGTGGPDTYDAGREKPQHYGRTGQVIRVTPTGDKFSMAKNLPSIVTAVNEECGPSAIAFIGDRAYILMASGGWDFGNPAYHSGVYLLQSDGSVKLIWDMTAHVLANPGRARREDPRADVPAGMAYGMTALDGKLYVTDANQEQLFEIDPATGSARQVVEYPKSNRAMTGVAAGPDGAIYVAEWASNKITRITLDGQIGDAATKLRMPIGVTFGPDGAMYVVEFTGRVLRAAPVGEEQKDILVEGLRAPTAITFGPDGNLYVSVHGQNAPNGEGEILRLRLAPPSAEQEHARWANAAAWASGLLVFAALMAMGWRFRQRGARG